jgi:hypothetical protein
MPEKTDFKNKKQNFVEAHSNNRDEGDFNLDFYLFF